jgi:DNA-binding transcriptional LysR family regulator
VAPFKTDFASHESYCLVYPNDKADDPKLRRFREWLVEEAGRSGTL